MYYLSMVLAAICLLLLLPFTYITIRVFRIIALTDKLVLFMLLFLDLTLICNLTLLTQTAKSIFFFQMSSFHYDEFSVTACGSGIVSVLPVFFFSVAAILCATKWYRLFRERLGSTSPFISNTALNSTGRNSSIKLKSFMGLG